MTDARPDYATLIDSFDRSESLETAHVLLARRGDVELSPLAAALHDTGLSALGATEAPPSDMANWATLAR
jgi:hypothetical protein